MKKISLLFLSLSLILTLASCDIGMKKSENIKGTGEVVSKEYKLEDFKSLNLSKDYKVDIKKGDEFRVEVNTNKNVLEFLKVYVEDGVLYARYKDGIIISETEIELKIVMPVIKDITLNNDVVVNMNGPFQWEGESNINLNNDSRLAGSLITETLNLNLKSDTMIKLIGSADNISAAGESDSKMELALFKVKKGSVSLDNDARCEIMVEDEIQVRLLGESILKVAGGGKINEVEVEEDAKIKRAEYGILYR